MAYDEPTFRRDGEAGANTTARSDRFGADGGYLPTEVTYQTSDVYRPDNGGYRPAAESGPPGSYRNYSGAGEHRVAEDGDAPPPPQRGVSQAVLDDVFDDPMHGEPGRDRMVVHVVWEIVLLLGAVGLTYLLYLAEPTAVRGAALDRLLVQAAAIGLLALGAGLTLRAGAVNLALGPVAIASALHFAENGDQGVLTAAGTAAVVGVVGGLILAGIVVGLHVPPWAASLGAALAVAVFIQQRPDPVAIQGDYDPTRHAIYLFGGFAGLALLGGLLGLIKTIRRAVGRFRPVSDPAYRRGVIGGLIAGGSIVLSMLFAVVAGVLFAAGSAEPVVPTLGFEWTGLALGAALVAGTSAFGRRGGVFGTLFAVVLLTVFLRYSEVENWDISSYAVAAAAVAGGLVVTRLVESYGRPPSARDTEEEWTEAPQPVAATNWTPSAADRPESWSALPAAPVPPRSDPWDTSRWGTNSS